MIDPARLARARSALQTVREMDLKPEGWEAVAAVVRRILRAIHIGHEEELQDALFELFPTQPAYGAGTTRRGGPDAPSRRGGADPPTRRGTGSTTRGGLPARNRAGQILIDDADVRGNAPQDLLAEIDHAAAALEATAAEIRRIPHIDVDAELPVAPGQAFTATVYLDTSSARPGEQAEAFVLENPPADLKELRIGVWLTSTSHFAIQDSTTAVITLRPDQPASTAAPFTVAVRDPVPEGAGPPALHARFDYNLRASGSVRRDVPILAGEHTVSAAERQRIAPAGVLLRTHANAPDLEVSVVQMRGSADSYQVVIKTGLLGGVTVEDEWHFPQGSATYVNELMAGFVAKNATPLGRRRALEGAGIEFFKHSPNQFQDLYWRLVDAATPLKTMLIFSEERSVPWELMIPRRRRPDGPPEQRRALGVECAIGRWYGNDYVLPGPWIPLQDSLVLAPEYASSLKNARAERDLVLQLFPGKSVPATFDELDAFYAQNTASLLHFICHGRDETLQAIVLLNKQTLSAAQVLTGGLGMACRASRPLIFLNACEIGRPGAGLAAVGGFASSFIDCDAGAVIAPLWAVDDGVAYQVAVAFYNAIKQDPDTPFADILRGLRARAYEDDGEDSFAAYCFYGDPHATAHARSDQPQPIP